jgi:hypothetical protein
MNIVNRALIILEIVLLIVLLIVSAVVPNTVLRQMGYAVETAETTLQLGWPRSYIVFLLVAIPVIFLLILLLWLELRPQTADRVVVRGRDGTRTEVSTRSVALTLQKHIDEIEDVFNVKSSVRGKRGGVQVLLNLETTPEIDIPAKMEMVSRAARELIEGKMGLKVANINLHVKPASSSGALKAVPEPAPAPQTAQELSPPQEAAEEAVVPGETPAQLSADDTDPYKGF